jgi:molybdopterin adenylyltransferase
VRAGALTISSSKAAGAGEDESGPLLAELARQLGAGEVRAETVADDEEKIASALRRLCDQERCALVLTSGGTGLSPTDVTPEATRSVIEREAPGIAEAMRLASQPHTANWPLSRAVAGTRGATLIVNFPGNPDSIRQTAAALEEPLRHALALLAGAPVHEHLDG